MTRCKSPLAFEGFLVKAEVEKCHFCALGQDRDLGRKPFLCSPSLGIGHPGDPAEVQGAGDSPVGKRKYPSFGKSWEKNLDVNFRVLNKIQNLIVRFLKKGKIIWVFYWWLEVPFLFSAALR